jgi:hypothetical protein
MKRLLCLLAFGAVLAGVVPGANAQTSPERILSLAFEQDGTVSLKAQNVTVREIFAEWARQCGCFVVNAAQLTGGPLQIPVMFDHAPQATVLESLLRQAAGYVLTPKRLASAGPSNYDVIYILATSTATAPTPSAYSTSSFQPAAVAAPIVTAGSPDDEIPPVQPARAVNAPAPEPPAQSPPPAARPSSPGVSIVPIVPIVNTNQPTAPGTSTPAPAPRQ